MRRFTAFLLVLCALVCGTKSVEAAPSSIGLGAFSGSETLIDFNARGNEELIDAQYVGQGVSFGGALYAMTNPGDTVLFPGNGGGVIASNWLYSQGVHQGTSFTATFTSTQHRVGFYASTNVPDDTTINVEIGGNPQGFVSFDSINVATFLGVQDPAGFNSITVSVSGPDNNFLSIDDFRFEAMIPEPSSMLLTSFASLGLAATIWRRRLT